MEASRWRIEVEFGRYDHNIRSTAALFLPDGREMRTQGHAKINPQESLDLTEQALEIAGAQALMALARDLFRKAGLNPDIERLR